MNEPRENPPNRSWFAVWRWPSGLLFVALVFAALLSYQGAYFAIIDDSLAATVESGTFLVRPWPSYSCGHRIPGGWLVWLERFFRPAHAFDRTIRPAKWSALSHQLTPLDITKGNVVLRLKPEWKRHLPPDHPLEVELKLPVSIQLPPAQKNN